MTMLHPQVLPLHSLLHKVTLLLINPTSFRQRVQKKNCRSKMQAIPQAALLDLVKIQILLETVHKLHLVITLQIDKSKMVKKVVLYFYTVLFFFADCFYIAKLYSAVIELNFNKKKKSDHFYSDSIRFYIIFFSNEYLY